MKPDSYFQNRPIRSLQTMLRVIGTARDPSLCLVPDGIYGPQTRNAVTGFQQQAGLPATGITDQATWDAVVEAYHPALVLVSQAQPVEVVLNPGQVLGPGSSHPHMYMVQSILTVLAQAYGSIPAPALTGILDIPTAQSLSLFQALNGLPATGTLDKITWKHLALQYPAAVVMTVQDR